MGTTTIMVLSLTRWTKVTTTSSASASLAVATTPLKPPGVEARMGRYEVVAEEPREHPTRKRPQQRLARNDHGPRPREPGELVEELARDLQPYDSAGQHLDSDLERPDRHGPPRQQPEGRGSRQGTDYPTRRHLAQNPGEPGQDPPGDSHAEPLQVFGVPGAFRRGILPFLGFRFGLLVFVILFRSEPHQQYVHRRDSQEDPDQLYGGYSRPVGAEAQTHRAHLGQAARNGREYGRDGVNGGKGSGDDGGGDPDGDYNRRDQSSRHQSARRSEARPWTS